ncbi:hypothetical protein RclHR1_00640020 [Rhizophagus clarus]|uniref:Kinase-like domain-containing protein n=1 Tax=Rhizophagus clarus TaxID=94130 RepID=A0A2Z6S9T6_9GLOM|nr:hypothetical protein RclHR1_00640020 [Rhizophagus clarus]GET04663.1 kinase-like domain-containing protein [Rhizophagus clarus]
MASNDLKDYIVTLQCLVVPQENIPRRRIPNRLTIVLLWEISSCCTPFGNVSNQLVLPMQISEGLRETPIPNTPKDYERIYTDCWKHEPDDRPTIHDVFTKLEAIMKNNNITKYSWTLPINNSSHDNLSQSSSFYKHKSEKDINDGISGITAISDMLRENKKQIVLDYLNFAKLADM